MSLNPMSHLALARSDSDSSDGMRWTGSITATGTHDGAYGPVGHRACHIGKTIGLRGRITAKTFFGMGHHHRCKSGIGKKLNERVDEHGLYSARGEAMAILSEGRKGSGIISGETIMRLFILPVL